MFARDSIDGAGMPLEATVHYGDHYDNAFWDGERMVFGDGDGEVFRGFTDSLSVIGHELAHGVTEHTARLRYQGQSGAFNEHVSDEFGAPVEQYANGQDAEAATWLIGEGIFTDLVEGRALRSMLNPGTAYDDDCARPRPAARPFRSVHRDRRRQRRRAPHLSGIPTVRSRSPRASSAASRGRVGRICTTRSHRVASGPTPTSAGSPPRRSRRTRALGRDSREERAVAGGWSAVGIEVPGSSIAPMDVIVSRSGGLAGLRLTWEVRVEEQPDPREWYLLIEEIPWSEARPVAPEPDRFVCRIRCEPHEATLADRQLTGPWRQLVDRVQETAEPLRRGSARRSASAPHAIRPCAATYVDMTTRSCRANS